MLLQRRQPELYDVMNLTWGSPDVWGRIAVNVADDADAALKTYMIKHGVSDAAATVHAIAALHAIDRHLPEGSQLCLFRLGRFGSLRRCVELVCDFDAAPNPAQPSDSVDLLLDRLQQHRQTFPRIDVHVPIEAFDLVKSHMASRQVSVTETLRRAIAVLHNLDIELSVGWRLGAYRVLPDKLELTEIVLDFTANQAQVSMSREPMRW